MEEGEESKGRGRWIGKGRLGRRVVGSGRPRLLCIASVRRCARRLRSRGMGPTSSGVVGGPVSHWSLANRGGAAAARALRLQRPRRGSASTASRSGRSLFMDSAGTGGGRACAPRSRACGARRAWAACAAACARGRRAAGGAWRANCARARAPCAHHGRIAGRPRDTCRLHAHAAGGPPFGVQRSSATYCTSDPIASDVLVRRSWRGAADDTY